MTKGENKHGGSQSKAKTSCSLKPTTHWRTMITYNTSEKRLHNKIFRTYLLNSSWWFEWCSLFFIQKSVALVKRSAPCVIHWVTNKLTHSIHCRAHNKFLAKLKQLNRIVLYLSPALTLIYYWITTPLGGARGQTGWWLVSTSCEMFVYEYVDNVIFLC